MKDIARQFSFWSSTSEHSSIYTDQKTPQPIHKCPMLKMRHTKLLCLIEIDEHTISAREQHPVFIDCKFFPKPVFRIENDTFTCFRTQRSVRTVWDSFVNLSAKSRDYLLFPLTCHRNNGHSTTAPKYCQ